MAFSLTSTAFRQQESIPTKYTCDGENISPPLAWSKPPKNTLSFVLIVDDPDAPNGTWTHWILYNVPAATTQLPENFPNSNSAAMQGLNSYHQSKYDGPCPPANSGHTYHFQLYALDTVLTLPAGAARVDVTQQMQSHIIDKVDLTAVYARQEARV